MVEACCVEHSEEQKTANGAERGRRDERGRNEDGGCRERARPKDSGRVERAKREASDRAERGGRGDTDGTERGRLAESERVERNRCCVVEGVESEWEARRSIYIGCWRRRKVNKWNSQVTESDLIPPSLPFASPFLHLLSMLEQLHTHISLTMNGCQR